MSRHAAGGALLAAVLISAPCSFAEVKAVEQAPKVKVKEKFPGAGSATKGEAGKDREVPGPASENGSVAGTIKVKRTRLKTRGPKSYKHVIVYLQPVDRKNLPAPEKTVRMNQKNLVFDPHVLAVQKGTSVEFLNSDSVRHNVFCPDDCCGKGMDLGQFGRGKSRTHTFSHVGAGVMLCKLHPEMSAYVVVVDTPYFTVAEVDGKTQTAYYAIENVPPGDYVLKTWNKKCISKEQTVTVAKGRKVSADIEIRRKRRRRR